MAANDKVKFLTGAQSVVDSVPKVAGQILFATDTENFGYLYYDKNSSTRINMAIQKSIPWSTLTNLPQLVYGIKGTTAASQYTIQLYDLSGGLIPANTTIPAANGVINIPAATSSIAGLMTTGTQTFAGAKTFSGNITMAGFNYSGIAAGTTNADRVVWFSDDTIIGKPVYDNDFKYNPSTNTLKLSNLTLNNTLSVSSGNDSLHSTEPATVQVTGGVSVSMKLSAKSLRIDNGTTDTTKGFNLIYDSTNECLKFQFGN